MAIKPTIYKFRISLSDLNRNYYDTLNLTIALHPSETIERMMVRVLAYCLNAQEHLSFTRGLCDVDEPDIWLRSLDDQVSLWIDIGEPSFDRIKKATHIARDVKVYSFNSKSNAWWEQEKNRLMRLSASIYQFQWKNIQLLATLVSRTMDMSVTMTGDSAFIATESGECDISCSILNEP
ncbi:YaeQ protein [hydrothermal vent metagenome]|uniref:YaeQ protein n=1 Tax=hydrothermal vent metagenome TaxID=652676 RepID=A0A3B0X9L5_9ZZZZ